MARLNLEFAKPVVQPSMVRNVESGFAYLPLRKARPYARMLTVNRAVGSFYVNPEALVLLIVALQEEEVGPVGAVDWKALFKQSPTDPLAAHVQQSILGELRRRSIDDPGRSRRTNEIDSLLEPLNPFQLQLVRDVASRLSDFGSNIVGDHAVSHWERSHAFDLYNVRAIVTCMESELQGEFVDSVSNMLVREKFRSLEYVVVGERSEVTSVVKEFQAAIDAKLKQSFGKPETRKYLDKTRFWQAERVTLTPSNELDDGAGRLRSDWDALYLYERESRENLLVSAFRRARPFGAASEKFGLRRWGADHMNEILPQHQISAFENLFVALARGRSL